MSGPFGGLSAEALIAMLKDTLTTDLIPNAQDQQGKAIYKWMLNMMTVFETHLVGFNNVRDKNLLFNSLKDEESGRRWGTAFSKIDEILSTELNNAIPWFKDTISTMTQLASEMDTENRDLGKYIREGWNAHKTETGSDKTF